MSVWPEWFVYRAEGAPIGPLRTEDIADAILTGRLSPDAWIAPAGGTRWVRAMNVPNVARLVDGMPTRRPPSGMRTAVLRPMQCEPPPATVAIPRSVDSEEPPTERSPILRGPDGFPIPPPPPSSSPSPPPTHDLGGATLESFGQNRGRKARGA